MIKKIKRISPIKPIKAIKRIKQEQKVMNNKTEDDMDMSIFTDYTGPDKPLLRRIKDWFIRTRSVILYKLYC